MGLEHDHAMQLPIHGKPWCRSVRSLLPHWRLPTTPRPTPRLRLIPGSSAIRQLARKASKCRCRRQKPRDNLPMRCRRSRTACAARLRDDALFRQHLGWRSAVFHDLKWSPSEKKIARRVFETALLRPPPVPEPRPRHPLPRRHTRDKLDILRKADAVYIDQIRKAGLYDDIWQAFAVLLPVKTVGVMGDGRTYDFVVGLRAVTSTDSSTLGFPRPICARGSRDASLATRILR